MFLKVKGQTSGHRKTVRTKHRVLHWANFSAHNPMCTRPNRSSKKGEPFHWCNDTLNLKYKNYYTSTPVMWGIALHLHFWTGLKTCSSPHSSSERGDNAPKSCYGIGRRSMTQWRTLGKLGQSFLGSSFVPRKDEPTVHPSILIQSIDDDVEMFTSFIVSFICYYYWAVSLLMTGFFSNKSTETLRRHTMKHVKIHDLNKLFKM